jgi:hypothetical protein
VNLFFKSREFNNYWFETGTPTFLIQLLKEKPNKIDWSEFSLNPHREAIELLKQNPGYYNLYAGLLVSVIQFSYNLYMKYTNKKDMTLKNNALNSLFKG